MKLMIDRVMLAVLVIVVAVLVVTSIPFLSGQSLEGRMLRVHMMASGVLVVGLPIFALAWTLRVINRAASGSIQRIGFWLVLVTGLMTTATMFVCMLPIASTTEMKSLMHWHGYFGFAMIPATVVLLLGSWKWRRAS